VILRDQFHHLARSAMTWADQALTEPVLLHDRDCRKIAGIGPRCTCRTALDRLAAGTVVTVLREQDQAALVRADGCAAVWVERSAIEPCKNPGSDQVSEAVPQDYREWLEQEASGEGFEASRKKPTGGSLVFVRGEADGVPWRYVGHVHQDGQLCALLVDGSIPIHLVFDQDRTRVRTIAMTNQSPESVLRSVVRKSSQHRKGMRRRS
jgi:hypothetical protein